MSKLFDNYIEASHPEMSTSPYRFCADEVAMRLVEGRDSKREIVNMVRWLIMDKAETVRCSMKEERDQKEEPPECPWCGNNRQVWENQITGKMTCHRAGCHIEIE